MKKLLMTGVAVFLIFAMVGGTHCAALSIAVDTLEFSSLEELLAAHKAVREGTATGKLAELAGNNRGEYSIKLAELDELYVPTGIPAGYKLYKIEVNYLRVSYIYLAESDLVSEETIDRAISQQKEFAFTIYRWKLDNPMDGILRQNNATKRDLIGGVYLFEEPHGLAWGSSSAVLHLYMPLSLSNAKGKDLVKFAAMDSVDIKTGARQPYSPPVLHTYWYADLPVWAQWILRYLCFGWIWMK